MKQRLSSPALADRGARLAGVGFTDRLVPRQVGAADYEFPAAPVPQEPDRAVLAAEVSDLRASAAFSRFTESCPVSSLVDGQDVGRPAVVAPAAGALTHTSNPILLPDHVMVLVRAVAAYERCGNERAVALALIEYAGMIGAGPLARAVADLGDELADVPGYARAAVNRFRGGGP
ncbi:MAG: hypothetical protein EOS27_20320 [Mesorhizobium sp.]|nr:MAG: hypothetical protein EOS27_20320 [Mesorhizobium sp.]